MFETPGTNITSVHITEDVVLSKSSPEYVRSSSTSSSRDSRERRESNDQERAINT